MATVTSILEEAKEYAKGRKCDYHDYEYFKRKLHNIGEYGHEYQLAKILKIQEDETCKKGFKNVTMDKCKNCPKYRGRKNNHKTESVKSRRQKDKDRHDRQTW